jgi:hypothetical protein
MLPYIAYMDPMGMENHGDEIGHFGGIGRHGFGLWRM